MSTPTNDPPGLPPFTEYAAGSKVQATYHPATAAPARDEDEPATLTATAARIAAARRRGEA